MPAFITSVASNALARMRARDDSANESIARKTIVASTDEQARADLQPNCSMREVCNTKNDCWPSRLHVGFGGNACTPTALLLELCMSGGSAKALFYWGVTGVRTLFVSPLFSNVKFHPAMQNEVR